MSDTASASGTNTTKSAFNVYRLKENPTWVRFAPRGVGDRAQTRPPSADERHSALASSFSQGIAEWSATGSTSSRRGRGSVGRESTSSAFTVRTAGEVDTLADAAAVAALRYERHHHQHEGQRLSCQYAKPVSVTTSSLEAWTAAGHRPSVPSVPHSTAHSACHASTMTTRTTQAVSSSYDGGAQSSTPCRDPSSAASSLLQSFERGSESGHATQLSSPAGVRASLTVSEPAICWPHGGRNRMEGHVAVPRGQRATSPSPAPSAASRAATSHLSGSAAFVDVEGPLDSLYVPLRRPPPPQCEATRQHFSIFDGAQQSRAGPRAGGLQTDARAPAFAQVDRSDHAARRCAPAQGVNAVGWNTYQTSNGTYGKGC